jgi:magnesium-protoporphyrin IX monomethyl ester (oxidative) cyclase
MLKVSLLNVPFAYINLPSLALAQLQSVARRRLGAQVSVDVIYLNQDFAQFLNVDLYTYVAESMESLNSGFGEWLFRRAAFPDLPDNIDAYLKRYTHLFPSGMWTTHKDWILDMRARIPQFIDQSIARYKLDEADVVGMNSTFAQNMPCFAIARRLKALNPKIQILIGGANCESPMGETLIQQVPWFDFAFSGPSLVSFPQFLENCLRGEHARNHQIDGVFSRDNQRRRVPGGTLLPMAGSPAPSLGTVKPIGQELDIDAEVEIDYAPFVTGFKEKFPNNNTARTPLWLTFETSRGCWWGERAHCTFCGLNGHTMKYRGMHAEGAIRILSTLFAAYPDAAVLQAVDNIMPKSYVTDVFTRISAPKGTQIFYEVKADMTDKELTTLAAAGVKRLQPGIEALATATLKRMKKGTSVFQNLQFLKSCARLDINPIWNLLIGFPGEPEHIYEKYAVDLPKLTHLPPPNGAFPVRFDRFSPYFMKAQEYGLNLKPLDFYALVYPFPAEVLQQIAYYFIDTTVDPPYAIAASKWQRPLNSRVQTWKQLWHERRPELSIRAEGGATVIHDSRTGARLQVAVTPARKALLETLAQPRQIDALRANAATTPGLNADEELKWLRDHQLIFEEDGRMMSLLVQPANAAGPSPGVGEELCAVAG